MLSEAESTLTENVDVGVSADDGAGTGGKSNGAPGARLWRDRNFNLFWAGQTADAFGDSVAMIMIPLLVFDATGSVAQMGFVTAAMGAGNLISSLLNGVLVDRMNRRNIMIICDVGRTVLYSLIPMSWWVFSPSVWLLYLVAIVTAYLTTFFFIAYNTAIPNLVDQDQITEANGRLQATAALAYVIGPMIAGFSSKHLSASVAILIVAFSYGVSALLMALIRLRKAATQPTAEGLDANASRLDSLFVGIRFLLQHPVLKPVTILLSLFFFISGGTVSLTIFRLKHDLGQSDNIVGLVFGVASVGALLAGGFAPLLYRRIGFGLSFLGSMILMGAATISNGIAPNAILLAIFATAYSFGYTVRNVCSISLRQQATPDYLLGRVSSAFWMMITVLGPLGTTVFAACAEIVGVSPVLVTIGLLCISVGLIGFYTNARLRSPELFSAPPGQETKTQSAAGRK
ncbi:MAG TPA: MFS transporter [Blastocatellia bacterium]|nr:MFS transporter [Blastocatellia bacterium]